MSKKKKNKSSNTHTGLDKHQRKGTTLSTKLGGDERFHLINWERDWLPEFLWLAALSETTSENVHRPYYALLDVLDEYWVGSTPSFGFLSDFALLSNKADEIWSKHEKILLELFHKPLGRILAFYPNNPASWLVRPDLIEKEGSLNPAVELGRLRELVKILLPGRGGTVGHLRVLPLGRLLKHRKLRFPPDLEFMDLLPRYPHKTTEEENKIVRSMSRALLGSILPIEERYLSKDWPKYFWRHNMDVTPCIPTDLPIMGAEPIAENIFPSILKNMELNARNTIEYLDIVSRQYPYDLYSPDNDEILLGLLSRIIRLYNLLMSEPCLWARDMAGIMLRCLTDSAITFCYLIEKGEVSDYKRFRDYGEGQEKLLMLHLQDSHPGNESIEGRDSDAISEELGGFRPEVIDIELGSWSKKDTRKLATSVGMERFYRLVYSPTSSDLHGTWMSLKHSSFCRCAEPLHCFHRMPTYTEPLAYIGTFQAANEILKHVFDAGEKFRKLPTAPHLKEIKNDN